MENKFVDTLALQNLQTAEKVIKQNLDSFFMLFNSSPACMSITTLDRQYVKVNKRFLEIYGFDETDIIEKNAQQVGILEPEEHRRVSNLMQQDGSIKNETIRCKTKDGRTIYTVSSIEKMCINEQYFWVSSFLDITPMMQQQHVIEAQNREIIDSIRYARIIQKAVFPSENQLNTAIPDSFVLVKPKNIVTGDFYWMKEKDGKIFIAACDCTGHGVPGAFLSIIGYKLLNKFVLEYGIFNPAEILNQLNSEFQKVDKALTDPGYDIKDGMDIALCVIDKSNMTMEYAGAYNPVYQVRKGVLTQLSTDKIPIHLFSHNSSQKFVNYQINIERGDSYYLFSDGYADQFGGPMGKKFRYKQFQELILASCHLPMSEQKQIYNSTIEQWKHTGNEPEQTDDILILGYKIP